jgi:DNA repair exonuclease SbcCD ATPase subunit
MEEVQFENLLKWLGSNFGKKLESFRRDGQKSCDRISQLVSDLKDVLQRLESKEERGVSELAKKSADRFVEKSIPAVENFLVPQEITYNNLETLKNNLERTLKSISEHGQRWVPKMAPWYRAEIAEIDLYLKRLAKEFQELQEILTRKHPQIKDYESISSAMEEIRKEQEIANELIKQKKELTKNLNKYEEAKQEKHNELKELKEKTLVRNITDVEKELKSVEEAILRELRFFEKPFRKIDKLISDGTVQISSEQLKTLRDYLDNPLASLLSEDEKCSRIKSLLTQLTSVLSEEKLDLKGSRQKKAKDQINKICEKDILTSLKEKYLKLESERNNLKIQISEKGLMQKQKHLETAVEELEQKKEDINTAIYKIETDYQKSKNRIETYLQKLEQKIHTITGTQIKITTTIPTQFKTP